MSKTRRSIRIVAVFAGAAILVMATSGVALSVLSSTNFEINPFAVTLGGSPVQPGTSQVSSANFAMTHGVGEVTGARTQSASFGVELGIVRLLPGRVDEDISSVAATTPVSADGQATSTITVTVVDVLENPVAGASVVLSASGSGNVLVQPGVTTDRDGVAAGTLASTVAETKTVTALVDGAITLVDTAAVVFLDVVVGAGSLFVSAGPNNAADSFEAPDGSGVPALQLDLVASDTEPLIIDELQFSISGTGDDSQDVSQADLILDADGSGLLDSNADQVLQSQGLPFAANDGQVTFSGLNFSLAAGGTARLVVALSLSGLAGEGDTFVLSHDPAVDATVVGVQSAAQVTPIAQGAISGGTLTATLIQPGTISLRGGPESLDQAEVFEGGVQQPMVQLSMTASSREAIRVDQVVVRSSGTGDEVADVTGVSLAVDVNGNGDFDAATDQLIGDQLVAFGSDDGAATVGSINRTIAAGTSERWLVLFQFNAAGLGGTFAARLDSSQDVTAVGVTTGQAVTVVGLPRVGGTITFEGDPLASGRFVAQTESKRSDGPFACAVVLVADDSPQAGGSVVALLPLLVLAGGLLWLRARRQGVLTWRAASVVAAGLVAASLVGGCSSRTESTKDNAPSVLIQDVAGTVTGDVAIAYLLQDSDTGVLDIRPEFSSDGGATFAAATEAAAGSQGVVGLAANVQGVNHVFAWDSATDIPTGSGVVNVVFRVTPVDQAGDGAADTTALFSVTNDSTTAPSVVINTPVGTQSLQVTISYVLTDVEDDLVDVLVEFSSDGGVAFAAATAGVGGDATTGLGADPAGSAHVFVWDSLADLGVAVENDARIRITPSDVAAGQGAAAETANFTVDDSELFLATGALATARRNAAAVTLADGRVLVVGGTDAAGAALDTAELYDPATRTFALVTSSTMAAARTGHTATELGDGRVLVAGGATLGQADIFDPATESFSQVNDPAPRSGHTATLLVDGRVLIAGGQNSGAPVASSLLVNTTATVISVGANMTVAREDHVAVRLENDQVLLAGGHDATSATLASAELFDPAGTFTATGSMAFAREDFTATRVPLVAATDLVILAAGRDQSDIRRDDLEVFDPDTGTFTLALGVLSATRAGHTATLVTDGVPGGLEDVILLAGGLGRASADILEPGATPAVTLVVRAPKNSMGAVRGFHVAAVVTISAQDRVLVAGGEDLGGTAQAVADEFAPIP